MISCKLKCYDKEHYDLTGEYIDKWLNFIFDIKDAKAIKEITDDETCIYFDNREFIIDMKFELIAKLKEESENYKFYNKN